MKKSRGSVLPGTINSLFKLLLMTKLAIILVISFSFQGFARSYGQHSISLKLENVRLKAAFRAIEELGYFRFVYKDEILPRSKRVSLAVKDASLDEVLLKILNNTSLNYRKLSDNLIVITAERTGIPGTSPPDPVRIRGRVVNTQSEPLAGVSIQEKGTNNGTTSGPDGTYSLEITDPGATLVFSYVGYQARELKVAGLTEINVTLIAESTSLNDVVVIGYQAVRRKDLTGATGVVNMEDANKITSGSVAEAIQGLVPGVSVRNGGAPGQNSTIEIRGVSNFGNSAPLYVIDGMLADANSTVNTDDIASVQVLKDASAAAIYGSRAGNGVVIITTKKGKAGEPRFNLSAKYGDQRQPKRWKMMDAPQYLKTVQTEYANSGVNLPADVAAQLASNTINTDWQDAVFRPGNDQNYNLGISGGAKNSNYLISGSYYKNLGDVIGYDFQRLSLRINTEARKGILTIGENMMLSNTTGHNPGGGINPFYEAPNMLPTIAVQGDQYKTIPSNPAGWGMGSTTNPTYASNFVAVNALDKINYNFAKIIGNAYAEIRLTGWLNYRFNIGVEASFDYNREIRDTGIWRYANQPPATSASEDRERFTNFLMEHTLNFNKSFGLHTINGVVGFSRTEQKRDYTSASRTNLQTLNGQQYTTIGSAIGNPSADGGESTFWRSHGYLGRINYAYNDKYLLTLTGRIDQDSRFGSNFRTGYFPSAAVAWRISKESFFNVAWISDLKIRASYGKLGFSDVLGSWDAIAILNNNTRAVYGVSQAPIVGEYQAALANPNLHWETRIQKNIGFDASLFGNRLLLSADYYHTQSEDVLVTLRIPAYLGSVSNPSPPVNAGAIRNTGFEFSATYRSAPGDLRWDVSGNFTTIRNRVLSVGNQGTDAAGNKLNYLEPTNFLRAQVGHAIGEWYMIRTDGIFQSQDEIDHYVNKSGQVIQPNAKPGDIRYIDANGDGTINNDDRQFSGSPWPTLQAGAQVNLYYKRFSLNLQLVGVFGNKLYDDVRRVLDNYQLTNFRKAINPWSPDNPDGSDPRLALDQGSDPGVSFNNQAQTTRWLENGAYVRIRNVEIAYRFPESLLHSVRFSNARIYVSGQNLLTLTGYKGLDPDVTGTGIIERGFDAGNWPASRVLSIGLQCEF
jgi:TonB-linked SusC/RagA family outer membrane protein